MSLEGIRENHYMFNDKGILTCDMRGGPDICTHDNCKTCYYLLKEYKRIKKKEKKEHGR